MMLERCMHCFATNACDLRFTRIGMPYTTCKICRTRAFFHNADALRGVAITPTLIEATLQQVAAGEAAWVRERTAQLTKFVRDTMRGAGLPDPGAEPVAYVDDGDAKEKIG